MHFLDKNRFSFYREEAQAREQEADSFLTWFMQKLKIISCKKTNLYFRIEFLFWQIGHGKFLSDSHTCNARWWVKLAEQNGFEMDIQTFNKLQTLLQSWKSQCDLVNDNLFIDNVSLKRQMWNVKVFVKFYQNKYPIIVLFSG